MNKKICYLCGSDESRPHWYKYYLNNYWNGHSYICSKCYNKKKYPVKCTREEYLKYKHGLKKCFICGSDKTISNWYKYYDKNGNWIDRKLMCQSCYEKDRYYNRGERELIKSYTLSRNEMLGRFSDHGKAVISQWIVAKTYGLKDNNIENDNLKEHIDLEKSPIHGTIDVKSGTLIGNEWRIHGCLQKCDNYIFVCMDHNWTKVEKVYIVPCNEVYGEGHIRVYKDYNTLARISKWEFLEKFVLDNIKPFNEIYNTVKIPEFFNPFDLWKGKYNIK